MRITISGLSGTGKSTAARLLSERLGMPAVDVGALFRAQAKKAGMSINAYGKYAASHPEIDLKLDRAVIRTAKSRPNIILQGRLAGLLTWKDDIPAVRIWLEAPTQTRASRIAKRENQPYAAVLKATISRDKVNRERFLQTYGLDLNDKSVYDIVVRTGDRSPEQVISLLVKKIPTIWRTKRKT